MRRRFKKKPHKTCQRSGACFNKAQSSRPARGTALKFPSVLTTFFSPQEQNLQSQKLPGEVAGCSLPTSFWSSPSPAPGHMRGEIAGRLWVVGHKVEGKSSGVLVSPPLCSLGLSSGSLRSLAASCPLVSLQRRPQTHSLRDMPGPQTCLAQPT